MARSKIGFHTGPGGNKGGLGEWERAVNDSGQAFGMKSADHYGTLHEAVEIGRQRNVKNWLGFRFSRAAGKISREVPDYDAAPWDDAPILCQEVIDKLPPEFDNSVWLEIINEPRDENATAADTMFEDMNATDYLGEWCLAAAKYLNDRGYKFAGPSFNAGRPGRDGHPLADAVTQYSQPGMLKYLRYCAANPEKAALALHEYSWSLWKEGQSAADWYPNLWGRFEAAIAAADLAGIPRSFHIFVTEFGFAHQEAPVGSSAVPYLDARNRMTARWPQLKYDAGWTLQIGWGKIDNHVNSWMKYDANKEFDEGAQPARTHEAFGGTLPGAAPVEPEAPVVDEEPEPTGVSTGDDQTDKSAGLIELSTQHILSPENAAAVRLSVSNPVAGGWQVQKSYTDRLEAGSRLEVAFLRESPETITPGKDKKLERVLGMDISYAQGFEVDFNKAAEAGVRFCFIRAASGKTEEDPNFEHNYAHAGKAGMKRGIYYYMYPEASATVGESGDRTPEGQARRFVQLLKDDAELGAVLDVEDKELTPDEVKRFVDEFQKHDPYERPITIYTAAWFWNARRGFTGQAVAWAAKHPLWVAQYTSKNKLIEPPETFQVAIPEPWKNYLIHQWTAVGGSLFGHSKEGLDLNYFLGSEDDLKEWARTGIVPHSPEPVVTATKVANTKIVTAKSGLRLRTSPSSESEALRIMPMGTVVEVFEEGDWDYIRFDGVKGYASSKHLSDKKVAEATTTEQAEESPGTLATEFQISVWPTVEKRVTQHFGERPEFYRKISNNFLPAHEGVDLAAPLGTPYYCVAPGTVIKVSNQRRDGRPSAYGWHVVVDHGNGYSTLYAHAMAEKMMVAEGDQVAAGQILAHSGNTGKSSGAHLHLTLRKKGHQLEGWPSTYLDPWPMLEPHFEELRPPMGDLIEGYLYARSLDLRANGVALTKLNLNLRARPDGDSDLLAVVPRDRPVRLISETLENGYCYCEVSFEKRVQPKKVREAPSGKKIDLLDYIKGDGRSYEVQNARGSQERFQTQEDGLTFYLVKNAQWEQFFYDDDFIYRDIDTSPGAGRYYRQKDHDRERGSRWLRRRMAVGESYTQGRHVQFYNKKDGSLSADNSGGVTDTITLVASHKKYKFETGVEMKDVIELRWENGPEKYFYARGLGMVGWAREHEDPKTPAWSAVAEIHGHGAREPFVRESVRIR